MNTWLIGDVQGCCDDLERLLAQIQAQESGPAQILFAGDLVNRGPASLATLRTVRALGARAESVLGNHDLHLLARAAGVGRSHRSDTIDEILQAPDAADWIDWLRHRPLALALPNGGLLVHAGLLPQWSIARSLALAAEVQVVLQGPHWRDLMRELYGNLPDRWDESLQGVARLRCIINGMTRLRFCNAAGVMDFATKEGADGAPAGFMPWFDVPRRQSTGSLVVCGHWSTLGLLQRPDVLALDTGCVWGGALTAVRLSDRKVLQAQCRQHQKPG
ncbi:symmetrical bis(5'-nucleosyl)-tetraphosphatase [Massilia sp. W12]|uniref:symmetrical bis(5'-nucleosyl)-tetraphosphatase n=1 Tax=Massilia sp. W12 TaxID=3126507 RepID=UPI0030D5B812